jgi:hypothetical protein
MNIQLRWDPSFAKESESDALKNIKQIAAYQIVMGSEAQQSA